VQGNPLLRFVWGFVSHKVLDYVPYYWTRDVRLDKPRTWIHPWLIFQVVGVIAYVVLTRDVLAIVSGLSPDIIEAVNYLYRKVRYDENTWQSGNHLFAFHGRNRDSCWSFRKTALLEVALFAIAAGVIFL